MNFEDFLSQIIKLKEKELEQRVWEMWLSKYPFMTSDSYISYEEMLNTAKQHEPKQEIPINGCYVDQVFF